MENQTSQEAQTARKWCIYHRWAVEYTLRDCGLLEGEYQLTELTKGWEVRLFRMSAIMGLKWAGVMGNEFPLMRLSAIETEYSQNNRYMVRYQFTYIQ